MKTNWLDRTEISESEFFHNNQYRQLTNNIKQMGAEKFNQRVKMANKKLKEYSIQYLLGGGASTYFPAPEDEKYVSVDWIPKIITAEHWSLLEKGIKQRALAFNIFLKKLYDGADTIVPSEIVNNSRYWVKENQSLKFHGNIYAHLYGIDLVTDNDGKSYVLEDNLGFPGGIGYALQIRNISRQTIPDIFSGYNISNIESFILEFYKSLASLSPSNNSNPVIVYLQRGPGAVDSIEHRIITEYSHIILADPEDLQFQSDGEVLVRKHNGSLQKVDVIYVRISSSRFHELHKKLSNSLRNGKVAVVTHKGNLLPGDKAIFPYIPTLIEHYLGEEPIIQQPKTFWLGKYKNCNWAIENIESLVIKSRASLGGKQVLIGPEADGAKLEKWKCLISENPEEFVAQEFIDFSKGIMWNEEKTNITKTFFDIRMFAVMGKDYKVSVMKGGISRYSPPKTRIVNISSGGGLKDVWVEED